MVWRIEGTRSPPRSTPTSKLLSMVLVRPRLQRYVSAEEAMRLVAELAGHPLVVDPGPP
jgi:hypothetical protein